MSNAPDMLLWLDLETTGLDPYNLDRLLEVAAIGTDLDLNEVADPFEAVVRYGPETARALREEVAGDFVRAMHDKTGLWDRLPGGAPLSEVDSGLLEYTRSFAPEPKQARLAGSSVSGVDVPFTTRFLPNTKGHLHYRVVDVSSEAFVAAEITRTAPGYFEKKRSHRAIDDIRESLDELRWLREYTQRPAGGRLRRWLRPDV